MVLTDLDRELELDRLDRHCPRSLGLGSRHAFHQSTLRVRGTKTNYPADQGWPHR